MDDEPKWIVINTNLGFDMKITFYKKYLNMLLTKLSGLTKHAHGLIGMCNCFQLNTKHIVSH